MIDIFVVLFLCNVQTYCCAAVLRFIDTDDCFDQDTTNISIARK